MSDYRKLDELENRMDSLKHILKTETDKQEIKELEEELDKVHKEYNRIMDRN
jgi:predicted  nucleic acid-binding Zn-ribbon protein